MNILLDTNAFLWFIMGSTRINLNARTIIENPDNSVFLSIASVWEIAIKHSIGRLVTNMPFEELIPGQIELNEIELLDLKMRHIIKITNMHFRHRDPFDRIIIAQSLIERIPIISADTIFDLYEVERLWD